MGHRLDLEADYLELIAGQVRDERFVRGLNALMADHARRILVTSGHEDRMTGLFIGVYPTQALNAVVATRERGVIVLVNQGLFHMAHSLGAALAASVPAAVGGEEDPIELEPVEADAHIAEAMATLASGAALAPWSLRSMARKRFAEFLTDGLVDFVLAHELAHLVLGHLGKPTHELVTDAGRTVAISVPSWRDEMAADETAWRLLSATLRPPLGVESTYMPPTLFFEALESAAAFGAAGLPRDASELDDVDDIATHPRAAERRAGLITSTHPEGPLAQMPRVDHIVERMAAARGRPLRPPNRQAVEELRSLSTKCDPELLDRVFALGAATGGVTTVDVGSLHETVRRDHDLARAAVASAAVAAVTIPLATRELPRLHLGLLFLLYEGVYTQRDQVHPAAKSTGELVRAAVPDVDELMVHVARVFLGQQ